jgi:hypothetical protein
MDINTFRTALWGMDLPVDLKKTRIRLEVKVCEKA